MNRDTFFEQLAFGEEAMRQAADSEFRNTEVQEARKAIDEFSQSLIADIRRDRADEILEARERAQAVISASLNLVQPLTTFDGMGRSAAKRFFMGAYKLREVQAPSLSRFGLYLDSSMVVPRLFPIGTARVGEKVSRIYARVSLLAPEEYSDKPNRNTLLSKCERPTGVAIDFQADVLPTQLTRNFSGTYFDETGVFGLVQDSGDNTCWALFGRDLTEEGVAVEMVGNDIPHSSWTDWEGLPLNPKSDMEILFFSQRKKAVADLREVARRSFEQDFELYRDGIENVEATLAMIQDESLHLRAA